MSRAELKTLVDGSSTEDRLFLAAYLRHLATRDDPGLQNELAAAHREIDSGEKVGLRQLRGLHRNLVKSGM